MLAGGEVLSETIRGAEDALEFARRQQLFEIFVGAKLIMRGVTAATQDVSGLDAKNGAVHDEQPNCSPRWRNTRTIRKYRKKHANCRAQREEAAPHAGRGEHHWVG